MFRPRELSLCIVVAVIGLATAAPARAASPSASRWTVRGFGLDLAIADNVLRQDASVFTVSDGNGYGLELEFLVNRRLGLEGTVLFADLDTELIVDTGTLLALDTGETAFESYTVGVNYHLTPDARVDLVLGGFAGLSYFDDVIFFAGSALSEKRVWDDDLGFGLKLAVDVPLRRGGPWRLTASVRYLLTVMEGEVAGQDLDVDPLITSIGLGYSF